MIEKILLELQAVKLSPDSPFTWTSGIKSPIYCDNRKMISYPEQRKAIVQRLCEKVKKHSNVELIAGTATAGIPWAAWVADELNLPMVYVRSESKSHGLKNSIEGSCSPNQRAILIEDLVSTGKSSINAWEKLNEAKVEVLEIASIFTYGLADETFLDKGLKTSSLANLNSLLTCALEMDLLNEDQVRIIRGWKEKI
ncbi:MAG: orotate phosphoribosyltransferase [Halobacteriovoraceae bacterium]|nr:orotate phosphoribosyltransferase [Halobacteriovoraceae bacterium]|tara:strand:+ start:9903 stop:10493 length:591 start_codon:yes stop_codon:yes gene_type:complete